MPSIEQNNAAEKLLTFIYDSPSIYHVVENLAAQLTWAGFE